MGKSTILYLSGILPARSETFVYREVLALRENGVPVITASVHEPETDLGSPELDGLAAAAVPVYGAGLRRLLWDAAIEVLGHPARAMGTLGLALRDAICGRDLSPGRRAKVPAQAVAALALARRIRPRGVSHIHAHMAHVPTTIAMYAARELRITFSFTGHANDLFPNRSLLAEKLERALFVNCISLWHREFYRSVFPKDEARLPVVRCGVDTAREPFSAAVRHPDLKILAVGRLVAKKGFDLLLDAAAEVALRGRVGLELVIAGSGPEEADLRARAARLEPAIRVEMPGALDNGSVMDLMGSSDLFVLPLRVTAEGDRDGIPVVLMEAMARGRCVISGDLAAIRELIEHGRSGYLVPIGDRAALAGIIEELALDRERIDEIGRNARKRIEEEFDLGLNVRRILSALRAAGIDA